jgi:NADPH:quinone reductase-like Zn-dependent oxidoreductase
MRALSRARRQTETAMQRVIIRSPGGYERLELVDEADPSPGPGKVAVAVEAIGINYADCIVRMGLYSSAKKYVGWPITPGFDFAGRVAEVGAGVTRWKVGDPVLGVTRFGAYQSRVVVPEHQLFDLPEGWSMARGAAFPTVHLTAWYALCELGRPRAGEKVLVHTAAGGVGTAALAIAKRLGLESVGVVGTEDKVEVARRAGADHVVVRARGEPWHEIRRLVPGGFDLVVESSGVATLRESYRALRPTGRLLVFGMGTLLPSGGQRLSPFKLAIGWLKLPRFNPLDMLDENKTVAAFNLSYLFDETPRLIEGMTTLLGWVGEGVLPEPPIREYPLKEVRRAHADLESTRTVGKLVLVP